MARPWSVAGLCAQTGTSFENIRLPCVFCKQWMDRDDCAAFDFKILQLSWKGGRPHGCCTACARSIAQRETARFTSEVITHKDFVDRVGFGLWFIPVRCPICLSLVSAIQKLAAITRKQKFVKVRGRWRTLCTLCTESDNDWERRHFERHCP
ncbi:transforming protein [Canis familiaris papillomavirus 4]|uniref:Protein E6 n=1 Tax=Canis familiaris papillomavirus 4 TaxID=464980 RepID=A9XNH2_9PAPI|nr:transforming protein [Canis familiaris papillomavirus 4]ABU86868.1 transforming protein [Canis familiaris papillomavirus 4]